MRLFSAPYFTHGNVNRASIALQLLFLGIAQLMRHRSFDSATSFAVRVSNWFVGPTIFAYMSVTAVSGVELFASSSEAYRSATSYVCIALFAALVIWMTTIHLLCRSCEWPSKMKPTAVAWAGGCVGIVALSSGLTLLWAEVSRSHAMPAVVYVGLMVLLLVATLGYSLQLTLIGEKMRRGAGSGASAAPIKPFT